jgi:hypothetical protein
MPPLQRSTATLANEAVKRPVAEARSVRRVVVDPTVTTSRTDSRALKFDPLKTSGADEPTIRRGFGGFAALPAVAPAAARTNIVMSVAIFIKQESSPPPLTSPRFGRESPVVF